MKAKELMIDDWVIVDEIGCLTPIKVLEVGINYAVVFDDDSETMEDYLQPIPLTAEILENNGWSCTKGDNKPFHDIFYHPMLDYRHRLEKCPKCGFYYQTNGSIICGIVYVHELQHALRLCGLNDLADNFKI